MKVLVTGGTGFLGKQLVQELDHRGNAVRVIHRPGSDLSGLPATVERVPGDITDIQSLRTAMKGCEGVYHAAAMVKIRARPRSTYDRINVEGTRNVFTAARETGVKRVVYTSSFFALGPSGDLPGDERSMPREGHWHTDYERTKILARRVATEAINAGQNIVPVYPVLVYGPGPLTEGNYITQMVIAYVKRDFYRLPGTLGNGSQKWSFSFSQDVVNGHIAAMEKGRAGEGYVLGGEDATLRGFLQILNELTGIKPPPFKVPFWAARAFALLEEGKAALFHAQPVLTREVVGVYEHNWHYRTDKAVRELGYRITPLREGLNVILDSLRKQGIF